MAGLELALMQVDGQWQDWAAFIAGIGVSQDGCIQFAQGKCDVIEQPDANVALHVC